MKTTTKGPAYGFRDQLGKQQRFSEDFQEWLGCRHPEAEIRAATLEEEKARGIDFHVDYGESGSWSFTVELKTDFQTQLSSNIAFEIVSEAYGGHGSRLGWGFTTEADWLAYIEVGPDIVRIYDPDDLRAYVIANWYQLNVGRAKTIDPDTGKYLYSTLMILLPLENINYMLHARGSLRRPEAFETYIKMGDKYADMKGDRHGSNRNRRDRRIKNRDWPDLAGPDL